jgi:hypothetical protein
LKYPADRNLQHRRTCLSDDDDEGGRIDDKALLLNDIERNTSAAIELLTKVLQELRRIEQRLDSIEKKLR